MLNARVKYEGFKKHRSIVGALCAISVMRPAVLAQSCPLFRLSVAICFMHTILAPPKWALNSFKWKIIPRRAPSAWFLPVTLFTFFSIYLDLRAPYTILAILWLILWYSGEGWGSGEGGETYTKTPTKDKRSYGDGCYFFCWNNLKTSRDQKYESSNLAGTWFLPKIKQRC